MNRIRGILVFSFLIAFSTTFFWGREVELQFHQVKEIYKPDFNQLYRAGFEKIIVRSFLNNGLEGGLLFENDLFKVAYSGFTKVVHNNKKRKFRLWGWLISRKYDWLRSNDLYDSRFVKGRRVKIKKLDIFVPAVRRKVITAFKNLAETGVEGILIQDDLAFASDEGFSEAALQVFADKSRVPVREKLMMKSGTPYNLKWISIKKRVVNEFLAEIIDACRKVNPKIKIGINVYYEAALNQIKGKEWHSQDLESIALTGVDHIYLMMYHRQMKSELKLGREKIKELFKNGINNACGIAGDRLVVKMEIWDWKKSEVIPIEEMEMYIGLISEKISRVCFTPVKDVNFNYLKRLLKAAKN